MLLAVPAQAQKTPAKPTPPAVDAAAVKLKQDASALYKAGKAAFDNNRLDEALAKFRESYRIVASPNSRLMISRTLGKLGKNVDAYREALAAAEEARAAAAHNDKYKQTAADAHDDIVELEKKIAVVTITVAGAPGAATLSVGGLTIDAAEWSKPILLDPGKVEVVLTNSDGVSRQIVDARPGARLDVRVALPAKVSEETPKPVEAKEERSWHGPNRRVIGYVSAGVGGLGMVTFAVFGALSKSQLRQLEASCPAHFNCGAGVYDVAGRGKAYQTVANVGVTVGAIGLATGLGFIVWDVVDGSRPKSEQAGRPRLVVGPGQVMLSGNF